ncbi:MAG: AsmA-like C-terminal region-containing protein [Terrimicrobiaceae bacterium]|nr:AsmA-like C-terminal region-containing protein [Terrimicrobiaceae bacterium]
MSILCIFFERGSGEESVCCGGRVEMKVHPVIHFLSKSAARLLMLLVFVGIPAVLVFLRFSGIGFGAPQALSRALSTPGLQVTIERLAFDPFSGLLAREVVLRERETGRTLARLSELEISLNLSELAQRRIQVDSLSLNRASISVPIDDDPAAPRIEVEDAQADVLLYGEQMRVSRLDGFVEGIRVELTAQISNPDRFRPPPPRADGEKQPTHREALVRALRELAKVRYQTPPLIRAHVEVDLAHPDEVEVARFSVRAGGVRAPAWSIQGLELSGSYVAGRLRVPRVLVRDAAGSFEASAEWLRDGSQLEAAFVSTLDLMPFLRMAAENTPALENVRIVPPRIEAHVTGRTERGIDGLRATGLVAAPAVEFRGARFSDIALEFAWKRGTFFARDVRVQAGGGQLDARIWVGKDGFRVAAKNSIPPTSILDIFDENTRKFLANMEFKDLPDVDVKLHGSRPTFAEIRGSGRLQFGRTAMRGAWIDSGEADFEIGDRCVTYTNMVIRRGEGRGTGSFAYDVGRQEARLDKIRSTLVPAEVLMWVDPRIAETIKPYRFRGAPAVTVDGMVHLKDATKNNLAVGVEASTGLDYDLLGKTLRFGRTSADVKVVGTQVRANVRRAALMGGTVGLQALVSTDSRNPVFGADIRLERVNFSDLTKLYFDYDDSKGVMSGRYRFDARMGQETKMKGDGTIRVEDGNVFAIPILGPFSEILGAVLPGVGYETARLATADFTIADEIIHSDNLVIEGSGFSMFGAGDIHFMTSRLDMTMRLNARGIPGIVFYPVSKLFEYISTGTVQKPDWRPKLIPRFQGDGAGTTPRAPGRGTPKNPGGT